MYSKIVMTNFSFVILLQPILFVKGANNWEGTLILFTFFFFLKSSTYDFPYIYMFYPLPFFTYAVAGERNVVS